MKMKLTINDIGICIGIYSLLTGHDQFGYHLKKVFLPKVFLNLQEARITKLRIIR